MKVFLAISRECLALQNPQFSDGFFSIVADALGI
jgi:hypothetical protein